jgi:hypothetical protein
MGDGRRLQERMRVPKRKSRRDAQGNEEPLFTDNYSRWTARPFEENDDPLQIKDAGADLTDPARTRPGGAFGPA